jgi:SOS-response transcriptional repressor LexA
METVEELRRRKLAEEIHQRGRGGQAQIARDMEISPTQVQQWIKGFRSISSESARRLEKAFKRPKGWMDRPEESVQPVPNPQSQIPLLNWAQLRDWQETGRTHPASEIVDLVAIVGTFGPRVFALHVCGDSMEPAFFEGDTIIVDPDRIPKGRDYVIVTGKPGSEPTFKQLLVEVDERYLKPANRRYHILPVTPDMTIVGVVVMKMRVY